MAVDLSVAEERKEAFDFFVVDGPPQADAFDVVHRHEDRGFVCDHAKVIEPAGGAEDGFRFDALNDAESMVWVNDLVTDLECHISPTE